MVSKIPNFRRVAGTNLYRCGQPEKGDLNDCIQLREQRGIRAIVDLRGATETKAIARSKLSDFYQACKCPTAEAESLDPDLFTARGKSKSDHAVKGSYFNINLMGGRKLHQELKSRLPWYMKVVYVVLKIVLFVTGRDYATTLGVGYTVNPSGILGLYTTIVDMCEENVKKVLQLMSEQRNAPCIVCCSIGKDRTGVITALVLSVLGFSKDFIAEDYSKSAENLREHEAAIRRTLHYYGLTKPEFIGSEKITMTQLLEHIDRKYGSVAAYLDGIGFSSADQARLRLTMTAARDPTSQDSHL